MATIREGRGFRVYPASKLHHAGMWRNLRLEWRWSGVDLNAQWLECAGVLDDDRMFAPVFWGRNVHDVRSSDALVTFIDEHDVPRGSLVEVGVALATGIPVYVVAPRGLDGTWWRSPGVVRLDDLDSVLVALRIQAGLPMTPPTVVEGGA